MKLFRLAIALLLTVAAFFCSTPPARAFCGFYVAKADTKLYNQASQVIMARNGDRTVLTMANDYQGDVKDFALVVPVPVVLTEGQVQVGDPKIIKHLDAFTAPRLVEYFDPNPCNTSRFGRGEPLTSRQTFGGTRGSFESDDEALGVTVESRFSVGEYDIAILSAKESNGLETWLNRNGYRIPQGASQLLQPYIRQGLKFFVAKVNLAEFQRSDYQLLRPLVMAYESPRFMLPIRLGTVNSTSDQDLIVYILSPKGQAEITNYRTVKIPSDEEIPVFVKGEFGEFYQSMFQTSHNREGKKAAFLEYAWDIKSCDPCSAKPPTREELRKAGVFWLRPNQRANVFISRIHVRYNRDRFPEDLMFQETSNRQFFQGRYVLRHPFTGDIECPAGQQYKQIVSERMEREAQTLAKLTGWKIQEIRSKMNFPQVGQTNWWETIFNEE